MKTKIKSLVELLCSYKDYSARDSVEDRLNKTLNLYLDDLDKTCDRVLAKKRKDIVIKEFNK